MPNGIDKNWIRVCVAIDGFRSAFGRWPTRIRLYSVALENIRDYILTPESFARVTALVEFMVEEGAEMIAEDGTGAHYSYGKQGFPDKPPDISALEWFGHLEQRPHPPSGLEAAVKLASEPNYLGSPEVVSRVVGEFIAASVDLHANRITFTEWDEQNHKITRIFSGEDADYTIMPGWHNATALGEAVLQYLNVDKEDLDGTYYLTLLYAFATVSGHVDCLLNESAKVSGADWDRDILPKLIELHKFVTSVLMGTNTVYYAGKQLKDYGWNQAGA